MADTIRTTERLSRDVVTRIVTTAIECQWTRNLEQFLDGCAFDESPTKQELLDDALSLALGEDTGCLGEEDLEEHVDVLWLQRKLAELIEPLQAQLAAVQNERDKALQFAADDASGRWNRMKIAEIEADTLREQLTATRKEFASQYDGLESQLAAVTQERDRAQDSLRIANVSLSESLPGVAQLQAQLAALKDLVLELERERNTLAARIIYRETQPAAVTQELEGRNTFYRGQSTLVGRISDELESLQARNRKLEESLDQIFELCAHPPRFSIGAVADITIAALADEEQTGRCP